LIAILEIPTGALADIFGRVRVITACFLLNLVYGLCLASLIFFKSTTLISTVAILSFIIRGLAFTLFNGSYSAWVADSINDVCPGLGYERLLARGYAYSWWSQMIGGVLGITLYLQGFPYVAFVIGAMICLSTATYCIAEMHETHVLRFVNVQQIWGDATSRIYQTVRSGFKVCHQYPVLWWLLAIYAYDLLISVLGFLWPVALGALFGSAKWSKEWYFMAFSVPMVAVLGAHLLAWLGDRRHRISGERMSNCTLRYWLIGGGLCASLPVVLLGFLTPSHVMNFATFAAVVLLVRLTAGMMEPCYNALVHNYIPTHHSRERATILSIGGMINGLLLLLLFVPSSGKTGATSPYGWILPASILMVVLFFGNLRLKKYEAEKTEAPVPSSMLTGKETV
jgi:MFS family permease